MKTVIFIDVQKDFIDGALRNEKAIEVTPKIVDFAKECVRNGYKLYATRDTHEKTILANIHRLDGPMTPNVPWSGYLASLEGQKLPVEHCLEGTDGWMIDERLWNEIDGKATVVNKTTFGSLDLVEILEEDGFGKDVDDEIELCGFCTSICVLANAVLLRVKFPNAKITVRKDLCADISDEKHNFALEALKSQMVEIA